MPDNKDKVVEPKASNTDVGSFISDIHPAVKGFLGIIVALILILQFGGLEAPVKKVINAYADGYATTITRQAELMGQEGQSTSKEVKALTEVVEELELQVDSNTLSIEAIEAQHSK